MKEILMQRSNAMTPSSGARPRAGDSRRAGSGFVLIALAFTALSGCAAMKLREAQDAFNEGARLENRARVEGEVDAALAFNAYSDYKAYYRRALEALEEMSAAEEESLREDGLWVTRLTLEALARWRLGEHEEARAIAGEAVALADAVAEPRDRALLLALPGLIKNDQAYRRTLDHRTGDIEESFDRLRALLVGPHGAFPHIRAARAEAAGRPVDVYLLQAGLAVHKNLLDAHAVTGTPGLPFSDDERRTALGLLAELELAVREGGAGESVHPLVERWMRALGFGRGEVLDRVEEIRGGE